MTQAARPLVRSPRTGPARRVRTLPDAAHLMAGNAQHLAGPTVAAGARKRISARRRAVVVTNKTDPPGAVRTDGAIRRRVDPDVIVTSLAGLRPMTRSAKPRVATGFERMPRHKSCTMNSFEPRPRQLQLRSQRGHLSPVAARAIVVAVAGRAEVSLRGRLRAVVVSKSFVVHDVARRPDVLGF